MAEDHFSNFTTMDSYEMGNTTTSKAFQVSYEERLHTMILFACFGSCGVVLNSLPILVTFCTKMRKNKVHVMVANLSTADLLFSVSFVFGQTQYTLNHDILPVEPCRWLAFFTFLTAYFEFIFPPMLSINRYVALYHSDKYDRIYTVRNIVLMVISSWAFCTVVPLIFTLSDKTKFDDDNMHCCIVVKHETGWEVFYWIVIIVPLIFFCDGTMLFCNYMIYKKLSDHKSAQTLKSNVIKQNRELLYFLFADMLFPIMFHTTYHVAKFISSDRTDIIQMRSFTVLYLINSCVRGLATLTMLRPYRSAVKKALMCACCKDKDNAVSPVFMINDSRALNSKAQMNSVVGPAAF